MLGIQFVYTEDTAINGLADNLSFLTYYIGLLL